jgi:diacylglycerol kinase (ATP)
MVKSIPYKTAFVVNPAGGNGFALKIWSDIAFCLDEAGQKYQVYQTHSPGDGIRLARQAVKDGAELVVGVGGDGTLREIVNGLDFGKNILGIIPAGTGNGFRRSCNIPGHWKKALQGLSDWPPRLIDVGEANGSYFLNIVGVGFDAAVEKAASGKYHNLKGYLAYIAAFFEELALFKSFHSAVMHNGSFCEETDTFLVVVANGSFYGGNMCIAPQASVDDSFLDLCLIKKMSAPVATLLAVQALLKKPLHHSSVITNKARQINIEADHDLPVHIDGEVIGTLPLEIKVKPGALRIIAPATLVESEITS